MTHFANSFAIWLGDYYLLSTALLALVLIGTAVVKQPAQRLAIVKATLVAMVLLAALCALPRWSVIHLLTASPQPTPQAIETQPLPPTIQPARIVTVTAPHDRAPEINAAAAPPATITTPARSWPRMTWQFALTSVALGGATVAVVWLSIGLLAAHRLRRSATPAPVELAALFSELSASRPAKSSVESRDATTWPRLSETRNIDLFISTRINVPVALGIRHPAILIPHTFVNPHSQLPAPHSALASVLAHELAHIRNHDLFWLAISRALLTTLWAQPLYWLLRRRMRLDQESLADAAAAELTDRQHYAEHLVAWARDIAGHRTVRIAAAVGLWEGPTQLRQRIRILLNERFTVLRRCSTRWRIASAVVAVAATVVLSTVTIQPGRTAPADEQQGESAADSTGSLTMRFEYDGTPPVSKAITQPRIRTKDGRDLGPMDAELFARNKIVDESLIVGEDRGLANVFVWVRSKEIPTPKTRNLPPVTVSFKNGQYIPHAIAFQSPRQLVFHNEETVGCAFFYQGSSSIAQLVPVGERRSAPVSPEPLPVSLTSMIQPWLHAYVFPAANPYVAVSDEHGNVRINNLPPGKWEFQVWHERRGYMATNDWPKGRFTLEIKLGEKDLGTIKLSPTVLEEKDAKQNGLTPATTTSGTSTKDRPLPNTLAGRALDESGQPIANAEVFLFHVRHDGSQRQPIGQKTTGSTGNFQFDNPINIDVEFPNKKFPPLNETGETYLELVLRAKGRASLGRTLIPQVIAQLGDYQEFMLPAAATLTGKITDPKGNPVRGAVVSIENGGVGPWDGASSSRTAADGSYTIADAMPFDRVAIQKQIGDESFPSPKLSITHRDYATIITEIEKLPGAKDVKLSPLATLEGQVVFADGKPAAGATIGVATSFAINLGDPPGGNAPTIYKAAAVADANGKYKISSLPSGLYDLWADLPGWINAGAVAVAAPADKTSVMPDLVMVEGGKIRAQLVDASTNAPILLNASAKARLTIEQMTRPAGRPVLNHVITPNADGLFEIQAVPGKPLILIGGVEINGAAKWYSEKPAVVTVANGETTNVDVPVADIAAKAAAIQQNPNPQQPNAPLSPLPPPPPPVEKPAPNNGAADQPRNPAIELSKKDTPSSTDADEKKPTIVANTQPPKESVAPGAPTVEVYQPRGNSNYIEVKCVDVAGRPIENVKVRYYRMNGISGERPQALGVSFTGSNGDHTFGHVIQLDSYPWVRDYPDGKIEQRPGVHEHQIMIVANSPGRASIMTGFPESAVFRNGAKIELPMREAAALTGRVTDTNSKPIAGAIVSLNYAGIDDFQSANTDKDGRYKIEDATTMDWGQTKKELEKNSKASSGGDWGHAAFGPPELVVRHPDYAEKSIPYERVPSAVDIVLERGGRIKGRVVLADADKGTERFPVTERFPITVRFDNKTESSIPSSQRAASQLAVRTDDEGYYEIGSLRPGKFSIYGDALGWFNSGVNAGLTDVEVRPNETTTAPDLVLQKGTTVHVQLIDAASQQPVTFKQATRGLAITVPKPDGKGRTSMLPIFVQKTGQFDIRMPAGEVGLSVLIDSWEAQASMASMFTIPKAGPFDITLPVKKKEQETKSSRRKASLKADLPSE